MPALGKQRHFEILRQVLALAEEQDSVPLATAAEAVGVDPAQLRELLEPVLYLEFRTGQGDLIEESQEFLLDENDILRVDGQHWLRDLTATPPSDDDALRLFVSGIGMQAVASGAIPDLDRAVGKLRSLVNSHLQIPVSAPPCLPAAQEAWHKSRSLCFRYVRADDDKATDREVLPYRVYCKWGNWYFQGREVEGTKPKIFRIDRMHNARVGEIEFAPPLDTEIAEWFDLREHERTLRLRMTDTQLANLPQPHRVESETRLDDERLEVEVVVAGERRLDYVLVSLDPNVEILEPSDARARQRDHAAALLEAYGT
jgi:hypothetical protein